DGGRQVAQLEVRALEPFSVLGSRFSVQHWPYNSSMLRKLLTVSLSLVGVACTATAPPGPDPVKVGQSINAVADSFLHGYLDAFPENALSMGARDPRPSILGDHSLPALRQ